MPAFKLTQKKQDQIKSEVFRQVSDFAHNKDYDGLYHYMRQTLDDIEATDARTQPELFAQRSLCRDNISLCLEEMINSGDPAQREFLKLYLVFCSAMENTRLMECGKAYDRTLRMVKNGEIKNTELIRGEVNLTKELALHITQNGTAAGRKLAQARGITSMLTMAIYRNDSYKALKQEADAIFKDQYIHDNTFDKREHNRYYTILSKPPQVSVRDEGLSSGKGQMEFIVDLTKTDLSFTRIPGCISSIQKMDAEQLKEYHNTVMKQIEAIKTFEDSAIDWSIWAREMYSELKESVPDKENASPKQTEMLAALNNASKVEKGKYSYGKNETGKYCFSAQQIREKSLMFTLDDVLECANALKQEMPEFSKKMLAEAEKHKKAVQKAYQAGANKVFDHYREDTRQAQITMLARRLERIEAQQEMLAIQEKEPLEAMGIKKRLEGISQTDMLQNDLDQFITDTVDILQVSHAVNNYFFKEDVKVRDMSKGGKHTEYNAMLNSLAELENMKAKDLKTFTYSQIMDKIKTARDAAKNYVQTHDGLLNITSGWSNEGRNRIGNAKYIYQKLDRQLREMTSKYEKTLGSENNTLSEREDVINLTRENLQKQNVQVRNRIIDKLNDTFLTKRMQIVDASLIKVQKPAGKEPYSREQLEDICAELLAMDTVRKKQNREDGQNAELYNDRKLDELKNSIKGSLSFQNMCKKHTAEELYQAACDKTKNALPSLLEAKPAKEHKGKLTM